MACDAMLNFAAMLTVCMPLKVPTALLGGHYRHRFDLGRCFEAWVPSTCSINVPHGLRDPCWKWSELHRGERLGSSSRSIRAIGTPWGSGAGLEEGFSDFLGHHAGLLEEHRRRSDLVPFFTRDRGGQSYGTARSNRHPVEHKTGPRLQLTTAGKSEAQPPAGSPPQAPRAQGVRRTGPARGPERCGRLGATPGDAPVASTPPRRREPGR